MQYEYKVVPAPRKGRTAKGLKGTDEKFAHEIMHLMNSLGAEGWEYVRSDTLPCEERSGFTSKTVTYQNILVFRRAQTDLMTLPTPRTVGPRAISGPDNGAEIVAIPTPSEQSGILGVLRARKMAREDGTTTYTTHSADVAAE